MRLADSFTMCQTAMTRDLSGYNQFVRVTRRTKRQREKANSPVVQVVQLESPLERLSDCRTVPYLRFFLVRNEEAGGSNPLSSTIFQSDLERAKQSYRSTLGLAVTRRSTLATD